ncbi:hypothetical protein HDU93_002755 [Gonapodya sp. JEL0774]|nr:hypothetical protein HDU93_002755 [Gonapodya sp. JEL0774]
MIATNSTSPSDPAFPLYANISLGPPNSLPTSASAIVLDYLLHEGYGETALAFAREVAGRTARKAEDDDKGGVGGALVGHGGEAHWRSKAQKEPLLDDEGDAAGDPGTGMGMDIDTGDDDVAGLPTTGGGSTLRTPESTPKWNGSVTKSDGDAGKGKLAVTGDQELNNMEQVKLEDLPLESFGGQVRTTLETKWRTLKARKALKSLLLVPDLRTALSHLSVHFPNALPPTPMDPNITPPTLHALLLLRTQLFLELVRNSSLPAALSYARAELTGFPPQCAEEVQDVLAVVAYENPSCSPLGEKMDVLRREVVAEEVGHCVMASLGLHSHPTLARLAAQASTVRDYLSAVAGAEARAKTTAAASASTASSAAGAGGGPTVGGRRVERERERERREAVGVTTGSGVSHASRLEGWGRWTLAEFVADGPGGVAGGGDHGGEGDVQMAE